MSRDAAEHQPTSPEHSGLRALRADPKVAAWVFDVLCRQADDRQLGSSPKVIEERAQAHDIDTEPMATELANVRRALIEGPDSPKEAHQISALAMTGFGDRLQYTFDRTGVLRRFIEQADWFEVASPYGWYRLVDSALSEQEATDVWAELGDRTIKGARPTSDSRAINAARLTALAASDNEEAALQRERIARESHDPVLRAIAEACGPEQRASLRGPLLVDGPFDRVVVGGWRGVLRWISGWALLQGLLKLLRFVLRSEKHLSIELGEQTLRLSEQRNIFGRPYSEKEHVYPLSSIFAVGRTTRFGALYALFGTLCFGVGALLGSFRIFEGVKTGETVLLAIGAALAVGGALIDLGLWALSSRGGQRVSVYLEVPRRKRWVVSNLSVYDADIFVSRAERRLSAAHALPSLSPSVRP